MQKNYNLKKNKISIDYYQKSTSSVKIRDIQLIIPIYSYYKLSFFLISDSVGLKQCYQYFKLIHQNTFEYQIPMNFWRKVDALMFPYDFTSINGRGNCCLTPVWYTIFRVVMLALYSLDFGYCAYFFQEKDLLYFTNWGLIMTIFCSSVLLAQNLFNWCFQGRTPFKYWKLSHSLFTMTLVFEMLITGMYWGGIFPFSITKWKRITLYDILNPIMAHVVPVCLLLIDFHFNLVVIWNSIYVPFYIGLLLLYLIINCVVTLEITIIYDMMTYKNWITYVFILACLITVLVCHFMVRLYCKFCKEPSVLRIFDQAQEVVSLFKGVSIPAPSPPIPVPRKNQSNITTMTNVTFFNNRKFDGTTFTTMP